MEVQKIQKVQITETILSMTPGQEVLFTPDEACESVLRATLVKLHKKGAARFSVQKVKGLGCKVVHL